MYAQTQSVLLSEVKVSKSLSGVETRQILVCVCVCDLKVYKWSIISPHLVDIAHSCNSYCAD